MTADERPVYQLKTPPAVLDSYDEARERAHALKPKLRERVAVNMLYEEGGGSGLFESSPLQRFWRDTNAAAAHRGLTADWILAGYARRQLGVPADPRLPVLTEHSLVSGCWVELR